MSPTSKSYGERVLVAIRRQCERHRTRPACGSETETTEEDRMSRRARNVLAAGAVLIVLSLLLPAFAAAQECRAEVEATDSVRVRVACPLPAPDTVLRVDSVTVVDTVLRVDTVFTDTADAEPEPEPTEPPVMPADIAVEVVSERSDTVEVHADWSDVDGATWYRLRQGFNDGTPAARNFTSSVSENTIPVPRQGEDERIWLCARAGNDLGLSSPRCTSLSVPAAVEDTSTTEPEPEPEPQQPQNQDALLTGMTPSNLTVPEGWTLQAKDDFEASPAGAVKAKGRIVSSRSHTGSHSVSAQISGDGHETKVQYGPIDSREVYVSWWEYLSPETRFNDETFFARLVKHTPQGFGEVILDYFGTGSTGWNSTDAFVLFNEQATIPMGDHAAWDTYKLFTRPVGRWVQYEWHFRANTPGSSDGYAAFYRDGEQIIEATNVNWSGETDMKGMEVEVSYLYTRHNWFEDYPGNPDFDTENQVCSGGIGHGQAVAESDGTQSHRQWSFGEGKGVCDPPSSSGRTGEIQPTAPIHRVWIDDVIVLER